MTDGYTIYGNEILTNTDFSSIDDVLVNNAGITVADNLLSVSDQSEDVFGELTVMSTGLWSSANYTINVQEGEIYKFDIEVFSVGSSDTSNGSIIIHDGEFSEDNGFRQFLNTSGQDIWSVSSFNFKAISNTITISLNAVTTAKFRKPTLYKIIFTELPKNKLLDIFDGESDENILENDEYIILNSEPTQILLSNDISYKYVEIDYDVISNDDNNDIIIPLSSTTATSIDKSIGRHLVRLDFIHNILSFSSIDATLIIHKIRIIKPIAFMLETSVKLELSSDDITTNQPILTIDGTDNSILSISRIDNITYLTTREISFIGIWLANTVVDIRLKYGNAGSMVSADGTRPEFPNIISDERRYQIGYSTDGKLNFKYSPSILFTPTEETLIIDDFGNLAVSDDGSFIYSPNTLFLPTYEVFITDEDGNFITDEIGNSITYRDYTTDRIPSNRILRLTNGTPDFDMTFINLIIYKEIDIAEYELRYLWDFTKKEIQSDGNFFIQNSNGTYSFNSDGLYISSTETEIPIITFINKDVNLTNINNIEKFNSIISTTDNILSISPIGTISTGYSNGYLIIDTVPGHIYNVICEMSISNASSENRIFINDDFALNDTGRVSSSLITTANTMHTISLDFTTLSTKTIVRFSTDDANITNIKNIYISSKSFVNSVDNIDIGLPFSRFTAIGNSNNATVSVNGSGNLEINGDSYSYFDIITQIGIEYTISTKLKISDIDTGNILHGKILALDENIVLNISDEITLRNTFIDTDLTFTATKNSTKIAFHPGRNIDIICAPTSVRQTDFIEYIEYTINADQEPSPTLNRKYEYIYQAIIPEFLKNNNPLFVDYMKMFGRFIDNTFGKFIYGLIDLYNVDNADSGFLDLLLNQYFKDVFDKNTMTISEDNIRVFITLSKLILNLKLNKSSLDFLFTNLKNFQYMDSSGNTITIDKLTSTYFENEDWWIPTEQWFIDNPSTGPYKVYEQSSTTRPFTYQFTLNNSKDAINRLLESVHPVGYLLEFLQQYDFFDICSVTDEVVLTASFFNYYDSTVNFDGEIQYSGRKTVSINDGTIIA